MTSDVKGESPHLPKMMQTEGGMAPEAPSSVKAVGLERSLLLDLALKAGHTVPNFTTEWMAHFLMLPKSVTNDLLDQLRQELMLEVLGQAESFGYRYSISGKGRERVLRSLDISGYIGPVPVTLDAYEAMLQWQVSQTPHISTDQVNTALEGLVLTEEVKRVAGLSISSGRSLFLYGPAGNGKTTIGRKLHSALKGNIWIPYSIMVGSNVIRLFDEHCHEIVKHDLGRLQSYDQRWIKIKRPFLVAGGEMTLASLDLSYIPSLRYYEAPLHMKANGGTFLIDDFGRQRVAPAELLNRWIVPLESQFDYLSLQSGQKIQVPFLLMLIIATNLDPRDVTDPAFLRRLGYRMRVEPPAPETYIQIFNNYAAGCGMTVRPESLSRLLERYHATGRELRSCEPRDLIERMRDVVRHMEKRPEINDELLNIAWEGYFGKDEEAAA